MARSTRFSVTSGKSDVPAPIEEVSRADARALKKGKEPHITQGNKEIAKNKGEAEAAATSEATLAPFAPGREADKRKSAQKSPKTMVRVSARAVKRKSAQKSPKTTTKMMRVSDLDGDDLDDDDDDDDDVSKSRVSSPPRQAPALPRPATRSSPSSLPPPVLRPAPPLPPRRRRSPLLSRPSSSGLQSRSSKAPTGGRPL